MPAVIALKGTRPRVRQMNKPCDDDREPRLCWRELFQQAMGGIYQSDERLEYYIDRIERMP